MIAPAPWHTEWTHEQTVYTTASVGGNGSASVLPMTDEEKAAVVKRPIGFAPPHGCGAAAACPPHTSTRHPKAQKGGTP